MTGLFFLLGLGATAIGSFLFENQPTLNKVAGILIIAMGLLFVGSVLVFTFFLLLVVYAVVTFEKIDLCLRVGVEQCK